MKILTRAYLVLAMVAGIAGVAQCFHWHEYFGTLNSFLCLVAFIPPAVFLFAYAIGRAYATDGKIQRLIARAVALLVCVLGIALWVSISTDGDNEMAGFTPVVTAKRYEEILRTQWDPECHRRDLVQHFPRPIPADAANVRFSSFPGFLQGGAHIQLRYRTAPGTITELYERFSRKATKSFTGGDSGDHMHVKDGMPTTAFYTSGSEKHTFPDDFEVMIFDPVLKTKDRPADFYWNHGKSHGVAISKKRSEIVYWAEQW